MHSVWEGAGSKHVMCVDDDVQCVGRDWDVSIYILCVSMAFAQSVWGKSH